MFLVFFFFFFFNDTATTEIYTLSLQTLFRSLFPEHKIWSVYAAWIAAYDVYAVAHHGTRQWAAFANARIRARLRSEEHTSELQSQSNLVCRLLLEKKK